MSTGEGVVGRPVAATFRVGFDAPRGAASTSAWRCASRLARREARRRPGRSLLVIALVAVPILAMTVGVVLARTAGSEAAAARLRLGGVADVEVSLRGEGSPVDPGVTDRLPPGARWVQYGSTETSITAAGPAGATTFAQVSDLPVGHPVVGGQVEVREGRAPRGPSEALLSPRLAEELGVGVGDDLEMAVPAGTWRVVGIGRSAAGWDRRQLVLGQLDWGRVVPGAWSAHTLVDLPPGSTLEDLGSWPAEGGLSLVDPDLQPAGTPSSSVDPAALVWGWVAGAVALVIVGIVIAAAFAVSARRQLVTIGQLTAQGAPRSVVRLSLALQGTWSGLAGALVGTAGGLALLAVGRPLVERIAGRALGGYVVRPSDLGVIVATGVVAGTVAALVPARSAARVPVLAALAGRRPSGRVPRWLVPAGLVLFAGGLGLLGTAAAMGSSHTTQVNLMAAVAVLGGLGVVFGTCCASPLVVDGAGRLGGRLRGSWRLAARSLGRQRTRSAGVVTAIAVTGAAAVLALTVVATAAAAWSPSSGGYDGLPPLPPDLVKVTPDPFGPRGHLVGTAPAGDAPLSPAVVAELEAVLPGATITPRRVVVPPAQPEWAWRAEVADPVVLDALGLSARDRALLEESGALVISRWAGTGPGPDPVSLPGVDRAVPVRRDLPRTQLGGSAELLVTEAGARRLGLPVVVSGAWVRVPEPLTGGQRDRLRVLRDALITTGHDSVFDRAAGEGAGSTEADKGSIWIEWDDRGSWPVRPGLVRLVQGAVAAAALLVTLLVVAIGLSLSATESRDEHDVLVAVGARPRTLRRMAGVKALLLTATAMVLALPAGLLPALVVIDRVASRSPVVPVAHLALLLAGIPLAAGVVAWGASSVAQRLRPAPASTWSPD